MGFPSDLILSGPILRRVEPTLVSVQIVTQESCTVRLSLWDGFVSDESDARLFSPPATIWGEGGVTKTLRLGEKLHLAVVALKLPPEKRLQPGRLYSYNITLTTDQAQHDLKSAKLLEDALESSTQKAHLALGYARNRLPSFALPPNELTDLQIAHGSCRRINKLLDDGLSWADDFIRRDLTNPNRRLHHLLLTGDQIYADDVPQPLLPQLLRRGRQLLGKDEFLTVSDPANPNNALVYPADDAHFPPGMRHQLIQSEARFTTVDAAHHLISFGEFAAMYLFSWCNAAWDLEDLEDFDTTFSSFVFTSDDTPTIPETWWQIFKRRTFVTPDDDGVIRITKDEEREIEDAPLEKFVRFLFHELSKNDIPHADSLRQKLRRALKQPPAGEPNRLDPALLTHEKITQLSSEDFQRFSEIYTFALSLSENELIDFRRFIKELQGHYGGLLQRGQSAETRKAEVRSFYRTLPKVRRALANVPTLMMFDDHEVTDDWNLNPLWRDRVLTSPLGRAIIRNGMLAYALFQGWGNDPEKFAQGNHRKLLEHAEKLFATDNPVTQHETAAKIDPLFGLDKPAQANNTEQLSWHYSVRGPKHLLLGLDCRTRRSFATRYGPPGNISDSALKEQIPEKPPDGVEVVLAIVSLPVLAPQMFDEIIAPLSYRVFDTKTYISSANARLKGMPGLDPDAIEGWANDPERFEAILKRLEPFRRVVLLSGDVHYGSTQILSYWKKSDQEPARFVQCISSGMRNEMSPTVRPIERVFARMQKLITAQIGNERLGWNKGNDALLELPSGTRAVPALKAKMKKSPALLPTTGWPDGATLKTPADWAWRATSLRDERSDQARPEFIRPVPLGLQDAVLQSDALSAYRAVLRRHGSQLLNGKSKHGRLIQFANNLGLVRFEIREHPGETGKFLHLIHDLYAVFSSTDSSSATPFDPNQVLTRHDAVLAALAGAKLNEQRPSIVTTGGTPQ